MSKLRYLTNLLIGLLFLNSTLSLAASNLPFGDLEEFTTDACTAFVDGNLFDPTLWQDCCVNHDLKYWAGGTFREREQADLDLFMCVRSKGEPEVAGLMYEAVRLGGSPFWPTTFRWGYGWTEMRDYSPLSQAERKQVEKLTPTDLSQVPITFP